MSRSRVLVLGPKSTADRISASFRKEGFEPVPLESFIQAPIKPDLKALDGLKEALSAFGRDVQAMGASGFVHPGTSAWRERPEFPQLCQGLGLEAVASPTRVLNLFANKLNLLSSAEREGLSHVVLNFEPLTSLREVEAFIRKEAGDDKRVRFPLVLKTVRSGHRGGSIRVIYDGQGLAQELDKWMDEIRGDAKNIFFIERYLEGARYLSLPFARFMNGEIRFFPIVDASLQQRHRRLVDICPAAGTPLDLIESIRERSSHFLERCQYTGAGSLDFLVDDREFFLVDGVSGLDSSFPLWETVGGVDALSWQLASLGLSEKSANLAVRANPSRAAGILARVRSEDPWSQIPQPGLILEQSNPESLGRFGVDFEPNFSEGELVPHDSSGWIGSVLAFGTSFRESVEKMKRGLRQLWIAGSLQTNERLLRELLDHAWVDHQMFHAGFLDEEFVPELHVPEELLQWGLGLLTRERTAGLKEESWISGDRRLRPEAARGEWMAPPRRWTFPAGEALSGFWIPEGKTERVRVHVFPLPSGRYLARLGPWHFQMRPLRSNGELTMNALSSGRVQSLLFRESSLVPVRSPCLLIESQHTIVPHSAPVQVRIKEWKVEPEQEVALGDVLAIVERA